MATILLKRGASMLAVLALAFGVLVGIQLPAEAANCTTGLKGPYPSVTAGSRGKYAKAAQCLLRKRGYAVRVDGSFSASDVAQVRKFQRKKGLPTVGRVGPRTWKALTTWSSKARPKKPSSSSAASSSAKGRIALAFAKAQLGEPYRFAGRGPNAWDCSGLTMMAWRQAGVRLPHHADNQLKVGRRVSRSNLQLGDLVFFYHPIHHVGIYAGNGKVIHAPRPGKRVEYIPIRYMPFNSASRPAG